MEPIKDFLKINPFTDFWRSIKYILLTNVRSFSFFIVLLVSKNGYFFGAALELHKMRSYTVT